MYEEEKLAGDVYEALNNKWNLRIFANILNAEDRHQGMVAALMDKYEIEYTANNETGKFENEELQKLYNQLVAQGEKSIEEALKGIMKIFRWYIPTSKEVRKTICALLTAGLVGMA